MSGGPAERLAKPQQPPASRSSSTTPSTTAGNMRKTTPPKPQPSSAAAGLLASQLQEAASPSPSRAAPTPGMTTSRSSHNLGRAPSSTSPPGGSAAAAAWSADELSGDLTALRGSPRDGSPSSQSPGSQGRSPTDRSGTLYRARSLLLSSTGAAAATTTTTTTGPGGSPRQPAARGSDSPESLRTLIAGAAPPFRTPSAQGIESYRRTSSQRPRHAPSTAAAARRLQRASSISGIFDLDEGPAAAAPSSSAAGPIPVGQRRIPSPFSDGFHEAGPASASALSASSMASAASSALSSSPEGGNASPEPPRRVSPRGSMAATASGPSSSTQLTLTLPSSGLAVPQPMNTSAVSPIGGKARGVFDTAPSFSSPLAYASVLPQQEQAEELDLDLEGGGGGLETQSIREMSDEDVEDKGKAREHSKKSGFLERSSSVSSSVSSSRPELSPPLAQRHDAASGSQDGHVANPSETSTAPTTAPSSTSGRLKRRSSAIGSMGPPLPTSTSRKTSGESAASAGVAAVVGDASVRSRKARGSGASDLAVQLGVVPSAAWSEASSAGTSPEQQMASPGGVPLSRRKSSTAHTSSSTRHRRAKSLGGMLLGVEPGAAAGSPVGVGGPEGVDPNLVAAIRAGDSSIPGTPAPQPEGIGMLAGGPPAAAHLAHLMSTSPRIASMPSTPSGSVRLGPQQQRRVDLLNVMPDTRALANTYPSMQIQVPRKRAESGSGASLSPQESVSSGSRLSPTTPHAPLPLPSRSGAPASPRSSTGAMPIGAPEGYVRTRVRSQTLAVSAGPSSAALSTSVGAGANRPGGAPLGEAIRLQRVPSSVRLAGDLYVPSSPVLSRADHRLSMSTHSSSAASDPVSSTGRHGLGIGVDNVPSDASLQLPPPQTPSGSRAPSPAASRMLPSGSTSGVSSPARRIPLREADTMQSSFISEAVSSSPVTRSQLLSPPNSQRDRSSNASLDVGSAFAPLLSMPSSPAQTRRASSAARHAHERPAMRSFFDSADLGSPFDQNEGPSRPAPWIASSQDDRFSAPRPGAIAMERPSSSSGRPPHDFRMPAPPHHRRSFIGPVSPETHDAGNAPASQSIDEYARIIVQSRNAKMQKWRSLAKPSSQSLQASSPRAPPSTSAGRPPMPERTATYGSGDFLNADVGGAASPPASPSGLTAADEGGSNYSSEERVGTKEIEWVDWLDEYRKMKEAKLRAEGEGGGSPVLVQGEQQQQQQRTSDSPQQTSSSSPATGSASPSTAELASELSALSIGPGSRPRRPSEMPRHAEPRQAATATPASRRASMFTSDKPRNLSLSPITSRTAERAASSSVQGSPATTSASASRRRRHLGGKIDAWWGAVKSGFAGAMMATPSTAPASSGGFEDRSRRLHHLGGAFGGGHLRAHTGQPRAERSAEADKSLRSLRTTSSAQNLKAARGAGAESRSASTSRKGGDGRSSSPASRSSDATAEVVPTAAAAAKKRQPPLALNLEKGFSSFDAPSFEGMSGAPSTSGSGARRQSPLSMSSSAGPDSASPRNSAFSRSVSRATAGGIASAPPPRSGPPSPRGTRHLSDTWRQVESSGDTAASPAMSRQASPERERRGSGPTTAANRGKEMDTIQRHIRHRLAASKESCDRELRRIVVAINTYVEEQMMARMQEAMDSAGGGDDDVDVLEGTLGALQLEGHDASEAGMSRDSSAASGLQAEGQQPGDFDPDETPRPADSPLEAPTPRRPSRAADYRLPAPPPRHAAAAPATGPLPIARALTQQAMSRARSRDAGSSLANSRSTSRSHSPMPLSAAEGSPQFSPARRLRSLLPEEAPVEAWIPALQEIALLAMEVMDASIYSLASRGGACQEIIAKVQSVGQAWDENPEWPGRGWYVRLLLAVAGLSRVVEWWEAERGFWNFEDEDALQSADSVRFIMGGPAVEMVERSASGANSPSRVRRQAPSVQSSAHSSPALDAWDRRVVSEGGEPSKLALRDESPQAATPAETSTTPLEPVGEAPAAEDGSDNEERASRTSHPESTNETLNVLMELSLDGESFSYLSPAWQKVVGTEPSAVLDRPITDLLAPGDASKFHEATEKLRDNDSHTVEIAFRLEVDPSVVGDEARESLPEGAVLYQEMEGKGMLMHDRQSGSASHTMWVFKPIGEPELAAEIEATVEQPAVAVATPAVVSTEPILCRICERDIPTWFFEKHSEICHEIHRLEMEIGEINETLAELRRAVKDVLTGLEDGEKGVETVTPSYRGVALTTPAASNAPPSALEAVTRSISPRQPNAAAVRKQHLRALDAMLDAVRTALSISTPAVKEDTAEQPVEKQRLLSPESESKMSQARAWRRPQVEDAALEMMGADVEAAVRSKLTVVNRTLNTIVYVETVRQEWEARVEAALGHGLGSGSGSDQEGSLASSSASNASKEDLGEGGAESSTPPRETAQRKAPSPPPPVLSPNEAEEAEVSAILLERDERELPPSGPLAATGQAADEDDIPEVGSHMGGSAAEPSPIPIPRGAAAHPRRSDNVSPGPNSALMLPGASQPTESLMPLTLKRSPLLPRSVGRTPPMSPHLSPSGASGAKPRRISVSQRNVATSFSSGGAPLSPRIPPSAPSSRPTASTIKDFDVIKPISKGAFGSVFLAKKRTTGDYYAIKVLRKADMIAKNQITNVKAERMILMTQTSIPFVVKLFFTFQSAEYLYFVMEYLPGGDCASLCKALGGLSEAWARQFIAEIVVGLEQVHAKGVVHRDMKPDNLLIDQRGHLKLTDFGLSKYGLLGRQTRQQATGRFTDVPASAASPSAVPISRSASQQLSSASLYATSPTAGIVQGQTFFTGSQRSRIVSSASDSSGSEAMGPASATSSAPRTGPVPATMLLDSPGNVFGSHVLSDPPTSESSSSLKKIVGTPDYLAPESVLGIGMDDMAVDWWAVGVILYEFLYGYPPFHAETPEKVFDNILSRRIDWEEETMDISPEARDLMERLMCTDQRQRLGTQGAAEIKAHPFFAGIDWERVTEGEGPFIPQVTDPESTDYFDLRGAVHQEFSSEAGQNTREFAKAIAAGNSGSKLEPARPPTRQRSEQPADDFGSFSYKNLPVLKQANDEVVRKMRGDQMQPLSQALEGQPPSHARHRSLSGKHGRFGPRTQALHGATAVGPPSPSTSVSSQSSLPSRSTAPTSPAGLPPLGAHKRRPSEAVQQSGGAAMERRRSHLAEQDSGFRRTSLPTRLRTASLGGEERPSLPGNWKEARAKAMRGNLDTPGGLAAVEDALGDAEEEGGDAASSAAAAAAAAAALSPISPAAAPRMRILIAEDNPISLRMLEAVLTKLGCQCVTVRNGAEAVRLAMAEVKFAAIFCDTSLPIVDGSDVARMIKATRNANASTPIVALTTSESGQAPDVSGTVFDGALLKPVERVEVCSVMASLGFKMGSGGGGTGANKRSFGNGGSGSKGSSSEPSSSVSAAATGGSATPAPQPQLKQTRTAEEALAASTGA